MNNDEVITSTNSYFFFIIRICKIIIENSRASNNYCIKGHFIFFLEIEPRDQRDISTIQFVYNITNENFNVVRFRNKSGSRR